MRGTVPGLASPHPLGAALPAIYAEDEFTQRLTSAFDEILAPVFCVLDNLESYLDSGLAPPDFVDWLAGWVGSPYDPRLPLARRRAALAQAVRSYARRGTVAGLAEEVALLTGGTVDISDSGGAGWSSSPGAALPGQLPPHVAIRVLVDDPSTVDIQRVGELVAAAKPAQIPHSVSVVTE